MLKQLMLGLCLCLSGIIGASESKEWASPTPIVPYNEVVLHVFPMGEGKSSSALQRSVENNNADDVLTDVTPAQVTRLVYSDTEGSMRCRVCTVCCFVGVSAAIALLSIFESRL